ncbi:MAG: type II CRISPR-associated endonuclease Cas1 [Clostridium sp.]|uniref:type II CRISPR-associated endonuclease Cas1 n=1 Tax=Clostridium sp. TaxID=1506 RepID=UPI0025C469C0|nr:type II CRISPR-associated endonuclease Cas1 [Clostridium sp.]MCF0147543.1 type II CRISPR-associated endonuclease Cas1 [Clostridium sp.]
MSWRVVVISNSAKLDYKMDYIIVRQNEITKIHLSEVSLLLIESTSVSLTSYLLCELTKRKIKVIFCDEKRNPSSELIGYYGSHDTSLKVKKQMEWSSQLKAFVWTEIVTEKIRNQKIFMEDLNKSEANLLEEYIVDIHIGDITNREGHAAKVYFNAVFGMDFSRTLEHPINSALNYGYSILLSAFNREITANGYITQIGLFHDNMFNQFNLGSDLMEPFRILVDRCVYKMNPQKFEHEEKISLVNLLNEEVFIDGKKNYINNAIKIYCRSVFEAINENDVSLIRFYRNEL